MSDIGDGIIRRSDRAVFRRLEEGQGGVILHLDTADYRHVNESGALIWTLLEAGGTREDLVRRLRELVPDPPPRLEEEVTGFVTALRERDLVTIADA